MAYSAIVEIAPGTDIDNEEHLLVPRNVSHFVNLKKILKNMELQRHHKNNMLSMVTRDNFLTKMIIRDLEDYHLAHFSDLPDRML